MRTQKWKFGGYILCFSALRCHIFGCCASFFAVLERIYFGSTWWSGEQKAKIYIKYKNLGYNSLKSDTIGMIFRTTEEWTKNAFLMTKFHLRHDMDNDTQGLLRDEVFSARFRSNFSSYGTRIIVCIARYGRKFYMGCSTKKGNGSLTAEVYIAQ